MDEMILSVNTLPYPLHRRIHSDKVRVREENGVITLTPLQEPGQEPRQDDWENALARIQDMMADSKMSSEKFSAQKQIEKELER